MRASTCACPCCPPTDPLAERLRKLLTTLPPSLAGVLKGALSAYGRLTQLAELVGEDIVGEADTSSGGADESKGAAGAAAATEKNLGKGCAITEKDEFGAAAAGAAPGATLAGGPAGVSGWGVVSVTAPPAFFRSPGAPRRPRRRAP